MSDRPVPPLRLLIADDEPPARLKLRRLLADEPGVTIVGEAATGEGALALANDPTLAVEAVLLDIRMPGGDGLAVAAALPAHVRVAFTTAHDAHALRAFELNAVDYLTKPYTRERLRATLARLRERRVVPPDLGAAGGGPRAEAGVDVAGAGAGAGASGSASGSTDAPSGIRLASALHALQPVPSHWLVPRQGGVERVPLDAIECVIAADNYVALHGAQGGEWLDRITLAAFLAHPAARRFVRVHRSAAVQPKHVVAVAPVGRGDARLRLASGRELRLSRRQRDEVLALLRVAVDPFAPR
jgi:two-component system LytT family response regulator